MKYSFSSPQPKSIISNISKIWVFYIALSVAIIYINGIYLNIKIAAFNANKNELETQISVGEKNIDVENLNSARLEYEINLDSLNKLYSDEVKIAISKILDIIPDQITISHLILEEKKLILKGITPSRETYAFLLQAPLKSIFTTSRVDYFQLENGWYNFTSINILED